MLKENTVTVYKKNYKNKLNYRMKSYKEHADLMLMFLPGLVALILFSYVPMYGIIIAFKDYRMLDGILASPWVGLEHFERLFLNSDFIKVLRNSITISVLKLIMGFPAPIILALLLNEVRNNKYKKLVQSFSYLPHFFSWVVLGGIITMVFSTTGPINTLLKYFGFNQAIHFFGDKGMFLSLIIFTAIWQNVGWGSVVYLAALTGIDNSLYEAAYIDGASRWKQTIHISIPCLIPTIITLFILSLGGILNAGFDQIYNLYNPMVYEVADIIDTFVLRRLRIMEYSFGTAVGLFKSLVGIVLIISSNWLIKRITKGEQGIL